jgi:hypothetical protein
VQFAPHEAALKVAFGTRANESWARKRRQPAAHGGDKGGGVDQLTCTR